jgi:hypothetical protein
MNPYAPLFSHPVDLAVAWAAVAAWLIVDAGALRRRFAAVTSRAEQVCSAAALAFLVFVVAIMALFAVGLVFLAWLRITSVFWVFWQLFYLMSVVCLFRVLPFVAIGLTCWAVVGWWRVGFSLRCLKLAAACLPALLVDAALYFWLCYALARDAA